MKKNQMNQRGFSIIEAIAIVLVLSMVGMTMGPSIHEMRSRMSRASSSANLQQIGIGGAMYANSNNGRLFSYSWRAGEDYLMPNGKTKRGSSDQDAAQLQNLEILQRMTGRVTGSSRFAPMNGRLPYRRFTHLVLADYMFDDLESKLFIDPADENLLGWHASPLEYLEDGNSLPYGVGGVPAGYEPGSGGGSSPWADFKIMQRWAHSSSYTVVPSAWQQDSPYSRYIPIRTSPHFFQRSTSSQSRRLADGRNMSEVWFPAHKVWIFEEFDREQDGSPYFGYDHARVEKLMFDGSVNSWASGDAYPSVVPERNTAAVWEQTYVPLHTFPVPLGGLGDTTLLSQRFRWTYNGLAGGDYGFSSPSKGSR